MSKETAVGLTFFSPFSLLLTQKKLHVNGQFVKTKPAGFRWNYRGCVYLRESQKVQLYCRIVAERHGLDYDKLPKSAIVGMGNLVDVRPLTEEEQDELICCYNNVADPSKIDWVPYCVPLPIGLFFDNVTAFKKPLPYVSTPGAVNQFRIPLKDIPKSLR